MWPRTTSGQGTGPRFLHAAGPICSGEDPAGRRWWLVGGVWTIWPRLKGAGQGPFGGRPCADFGYSCIAISEPRLRDGVLEGDW